MMCLRRTVQIAFVLASVVAAWHAATAQSADPLSEQDLLALVKLQIDDQTIVARLEKAGVSFAISDDAIDRLEKAGVSPPVLEAVRKAGQADRPAPAAAITYPDVLKLLKLKLDEDAILKRLGGTTFVLDADQEAELRKAGASDKLIVTLKQVPPPEKAGDVTDWAIILDCSGSMKPQTKEGPTKMEAAKAAVTQLIQRIPNGLNVTFLIYGHDAKLECQAVKVVRPLSPLDDAGKADLTRFIAGLQPAGHTPIARALEAAGKELGRTDALCGVVLITDGMETCHGDPAQVAAALAEDLNLKYGLNVVGFDISDKERQAVEQIAKAGKGEYLNAASATELAARMRAIERKVAEAPPAEPQVPDTATLTGHTEGLTSVAFSHDGRRILSGSDDKTVRQWDISTAKAIKDASIEFEGVCERISLAPDGRRFVCQSLGIGLHSTQTKKNLKTMSGVGTHLGPMGFSGNGRRLIVATMSTFGKVSAWVWDLESDKQFRFEEYPELKELRCVALSADGKLGVSAADEGVRVFEVEGGKELRRVERPSASCLAFSPDGKRLVTGELLGTIVFWSIETGQEVGRCEGHTEAVTSLAFSRDGRRLLSGSDDRTVRLWNAETGEELRTLEGHTDRVTCVALSPDGRLAASGSADKTVGLWNLAKTEKTSEDE